eukprot:scaffold15605_cov78-Skeletonema_dohrnii-CCMP3373.AAC.3
MLQDKRSESKRRRGRQVQVQVQVQVNEILCTKRLFYTTYYIQPEVEALNDMHWHRLLAVRTVVEGYNAFCRAFPLVDLPALALSIFDEACNVSDAGACPTHLAPPLDIASTTHRRGIQ